MTYLRPIAASLLVFGVAAVAHAQTPSTGNGAAAPGAAAANAGAKVKLDRTRRSMVYRHPSYYDIQRAAAYANPGGVGRYAEYYPAGVPFQQGQDPVRVATFGTGGGYPSRMEQLQAQQIGIQRYNAIQQHIDNYGRPYIGFGYGFFGGFN